MVKHHSGAELHLAFPIPALLCMLAVLTSGCPQDAFKNRQQEVSFEAMGGIPVEIIIRGVSEDHIGRILDNAGKKVDEYEQELSYFRPGSGINRMLQEPGDTRRVTSPVLWEALVLSRQAYQLTGGSFDVTVGPVIDLWKTAQKANEMPSAEAVAQALEKTGFSSIGFDDQHQRIALMKKDLRIDFGGIAKGLFAEWICRDILSFAESAEIPGPKKIIVNVGGDMFCHTGTSEMVCEIGIRHPLREGLWGRLQIRNGSVVTSGTYERFFEIKGRRYCHIVDPETGHPVDSNLTSVTMYDPSGAMADALATSVFVMGEEAAWKLLESRPQSQMIVIRSDGTWKASPGLLPLLTVF